MPNGTDWRAPLKRAARTFLWSFIALFGLSLTGWLQEVIQWASDNEGVVVFPDPAVLIKAAVAAVASAAVGLVGFVINLAEDIKGGAAILGAKTNQND